jgi:LPXTG-motif cell wall-anchored protein
MSARANLEKAKRFIVGANFASSLVMLITFFILQKHNPSAPNYWILLAGIVFAIAGLAFIWFAKRIERRFDEANIR